jgi:hypothetical protein
MRFVAVGFSICLALCSTLALAQTPPAPPLETPNLTPPRALPPSQRIDIRINSNFNISEPVANIADKVALSEMQAATRQAIYEIAGRECKLLLETIARECRLEQLNINSNFQSQNFRGDLSNPMLNTSANSVFRIVPKE